MFQPLMPKQHLIVLQDYIYIYIYLDFVIILLSGLPKYVLNLSFTNTFERFDFKEEYVMLSIGHSQRYSYLYVH